ncbi:hypothetical protein QFC24_000628 [Naganishia onofrii]|uniref:Uncharacterized protein n=1 Tax=Naganishia onofrii TaxID=1851511 RepID=A0ACC2XWE3_9TREE|nr:hypothetical protein QFC24_000628 [Naganishia onofrii]
MGNDTHGAYDSSWDRLSVSDLTPNVGLGWYFFTEMFDHFRTFFTGVFQSVSDFILSGLSSKRSPIDRNDVIVGNYCHFQIIPYAGGLDHLAWPARVFPGYLGCLGCGLGVLEVLGASLRNGVSCETAQLLDANVSRTLAGDENAVAEERGAAQITNSVVSAKRVLEERNLVVVQYTTLGDDE